MSRLATQDDVRAALRRELTESETDWIGALLDEASDLIAGYLDPFQIPVPTPATIARVAAAMVAAVLNRPTGILPETASLTADVYGVTFNPGATSPGPYLTSAFKERLRPYKISAISVTSVSEQTPVCVVPDEETGSSGGGTVGATGPPGPRGEQGPAGPRGLQGPAGSNGRDGAPGPRGATGATGPAGPRGLQGLPGPRGLQGVPGATGATGDRGPQGLPGQRGLQGEPGAAGATGDRGPQGLPGPRGLQGIAGARGATGDRGATGATGDSYVLIAEEPAGVQDGVNDAFTIANTPAPNHAVQVFRNGLLEIPGMSYTVTSSTVTFTTPPLPDDVLSVVYQKVN